MVEVRLWKVVLSRGGLGSYLVRSAGPYAGNAISIGALWHRRGRDRSELSNSFAYFSWPVRACTSRRTSEDEGGDTEPEG